MAVLAPTAPYGEIYDDTPNISAPWDHPSGLATDRAQARLVEPFTSTILDTSPELTTSVADGGTIALGWATDVPGAGFDPLPWGTIRAVQVRARATDGQWSGWSPSTIFATNSAPTIPSQLSPANGQVVTNLPLLTCVASDTGLAPVIPMVYETIRTPDGAISFTRQMAWNGDTGRYEYQTVAADLPAYGAYVWTAYSDDGHLTSESSPPASFTYAAAALVTIQAPAPNAVLTSDTVAVDWDVSTPQRSYLVRIDDETGQQVATSNVRTTNATAHTFSNEPGIANGGTYTGTIEATDHNGLVGTATFTFSVSYTPAPFITGMTATPTALGYDTRPSAVVVRWDAPTDPGFDHLDIGRTPLSGPSGVPTDQRRVIATLTDPAQEVWIDAEGASHLDDRYDVVQVVRRSGVLVSSEPAVTNARVDFDGVVLGAVTDPEGFHVDLRYGADRGREGELDWRGDVDYFQSFNAAQPTPYPGRQNVWDPSGEYRIRTDATATAIQRFHALRDLAERRATICYRDGRGEVRYVFLDRVRVQYRAVLHYDVQLDFREVARDVIDVNGKVT